MKTLLIALVALSMTSALPAKKKAYICTDLKSQTYHWDELCKELEKCKYEVKETTEAEAKDQQKRLCKVCKENEKKKDEVKQ